MFTPEELETMLVEVGKALPKAIDVYLIGGCAMGFKDIKSETKDVDIVLLKRADLDVLGSTLKSLKFTQDTDLETFYLSAVMVFMKGDSRIDLFVRDVCKSLIFTDRMVKRSRLYKKLGNMHVYLVSNEDIFLFKAITDREKDIEDCVRLAIPGLDKRVILHEMEEQKRTNWCFCVYEKICLMEDTMDFTVDFKNDVKEICMQKLKDAPRDFLYAVDKRKHWG